MCMRNASADDLRAAGDAAYRALKAREMICAGRLLLHKQDS
jgi:hypothetical protein